MLNTEYTNLNNCDYISHTRIPSWINSVCNIKWSVSMTNFKNILPSFYHEKKFNADFYHLNCWFLRGFGTRLWLWQIHVYQMTNDQEVFIKTVKKSKYLSMSMQSMLYDEIMVFLSASKRSNNIETWHLLTTLFQFYFNT